MSDKADLSQHIVPAHLGFLAIYNPSLGTTDETLEDQIAYYCSYDPQGDQPAKQDARDAKSTQDAVREQKNEQLRQIGLAQGMVEFGRTFSNGKAVDAVETAKSRIVLHELEPDWWILAV
jgi:First Longin domain of INTU, CCZ1 and HPS4